jgi:hypothetical protein
MMRLDPLQRSNILLHNGAGSVSGDYRRLSGLNGRSQRGNGRLVVKANVWTSILGTERTDVRHRHEARDHQETACKCKYEADESCHGILFRHAFYIGLAPPTISECHTTEAQ